MPANLEKAELIEIDWEGDEVVFPSGGVRTKVQFNPETLSVTYANRSSGGSQPGGSAIQYVGQGTTKLSLELWFDVTGELPQGVVADDVRILTEDVVKLITPKEIEGAKESQWKAPGVRFSWGSFLFDGVAESVSEKLSFFSEQGKPLRAQITLGLNSQRIQFNVQSSRQANGAAAATGGQAGTQPLATAREGQPLQQMASSGGLSWQDIARANGIENTRSLNAGALVDLQVSQRRAGPALLFRRR